MGPYDFAGACLLWGFLWWFLRHQVPQDAPGRWQPLARRATRLLQGLLLLAGMGLGAYGYVRFVEPNWVVVTRLGVTNDRLFQALGAQRIVQITDLHIERFGPREHLMVWQVNRQRPEWIVITGDLLNRRSGWRASLEAISRLRATQGIWVVPGNTDNAIIPKEEFDREVRRIGAHVLRNASAPLADTGAWWIGVDDPVEHQDRLDQALKGAGQPAILLAHSPDIMPEASKARIPLVLVGHTHGGQVGVNLIRVLSRYANRGPYISGRYRVGETLLYVNRGIGWKEAPYRFLARPEVCVVQFHPSARQRFFSFARGTGARPAEESRARDVPTRAPAPGLRELWLSDFETENEHAVRWHVAEAYASASTEHATHGRHSAKVTFRRGDEPKFLMAPYLAWDKRRRDWSGYETLELDLFNPQPTYERLLLQLKDARGRLYKEELGVLGHAAQHVAVQLKDVASYLDLTRVSQLNLFRWRPSAEATFYLDAIRLRAGERRPVPSVSRTAPASAITPPQAPAIVPGAQWQVAWTSGLTKLLRDPAAFQGHLRNPVSLSLAHGEFEAVQLALIGGQQPARVTVSVSALTHESGQAQLPQAFIQVRSVGYVNTKRPYYPVTHVGEWPDPLVSAGEITVPARELQPVWISVGAPLGLPAGRYDGTVTIRDSDGRAQALALQVRLWEFALPRATHFKTAFDFYRARLEQAYKAFVSGGGAWTEHLDELHDRYLLAMLRHRISPIWGVDPTMPKFAWDIKRYLDNGLSVFGVGSHGGSFDNDWPADPVALEQLMVWYRQAAIELQFYKLLDQAYVYAYDEPGLQDPHVSQVLRALHHAAPGLKTLVAFNQAPDPVRDAEWLSDADILCLRITAFDPDQVKAWQARGKEIWLYVSSPAHPFPNLVIDYPGIAHRIIPWMAWKYGAKGLLYWTVNFWAKDPWENPATFEDEQNGNGVLFYPGPDGPVSSIRLEMIRDGIEDYEYLALLAEVLTAARARGGVDAALLARAAQLLSVEPDLVESLRAYAKDPDVLLAKRQAIAEMIEQLQGQGTRDRGRGTGDGERS